MNMGNNKLCGQSCRGIRVGRRSGRPHGTLKDTDQSGALLIREVVGEAGKAVNGSFAILFCEIDELAEEMVGLQLRERGREVELLEHFGSAAIVGGVLNASKGIKELRAIGEACIGSSIGESAQLGGASDTRANSPVEVATSVLPNGWLGTALGLHSTSATTVTVSISSRV